MIVGILLLVGLVLLVLRRFKRRARRTDASESLAALLFAQLPAWKGEPWTKRTGHGKWL